MRRRAIERRGRKALRRLYSELRETPGNPKDVERFIREVPGEQVLHMGKLAIGNSQIAYERRTRNASLSYIAGSHAAPYLVNTARKSNPTETEALAAFDKKQLDDKWMTGIGAGALGFIVAGAALGAFYHLSHENTDPYNPAVTSTSLPNHTSDPAGMQSTTPGYEQAPVTTATPVPSPTSIDFRH